MPNGGLSLTNFLEENPPIEIGGNENNVTISFPSGGGTSSGATVSIPSQEQTSAFDLHLQFDTGTVISLPGNSVGAVEFPDPSTGTMVDIPIPSESSGLIDLPRGGGVSIEIPGGTFPERTPPRIRVRIKSGADARFLTVTTAD